MLGIPVITGSYLHLATRVGAPGVTHKANHLHSHVRGFQLAMIYLKRCFALIV